MKRLKVLVTGGAGFIGSHLVETMIEMKNNIIVYDNFDKYYPHKEENLQHLMRSDLFTMIKADILDFETLRNATKDIDVFFHLAAQPGVRYSMLNPEKTIKTNVLGTLNVLKAAKEAEVKRIVFSSTSSVYGDPIYLPTDEVHPTDPISIYGASKLMAEKLCNIFYNQFDLPVVILRYFTVYGPRQRPDMAIHKWTRAVFEGKSITIYGDGNQTRDFTYISDVIDGTVKASEVEGIEGEIFNIGGGSRISVNNVVKMLIDRCRVPDAQIIYESSKAGDVKDTHTNITKARKILGFNPKVGLKEGLSRFIKWFKARTNIER